jgi:hypothetical protein
MVLAACSPSYGTADEVTPDAGSSDASTNQDAGSVTDTGAGPTSTSSASYRQAVLEDTPIAFWRFSEKADSPVLASEIGSHALLPAAAKPLFGESGLFSGAGGAIGFDGTKGQRVVSATVPFAAPAGVAVEAWIRLTIPPDSLGRGIVGQSDGNDSFILFLFQAEIYFEVRLGATRHYVANGLSVNEWHHIVAQTNSMTGVEMSIDGVRSTAAISNGTTPLAAQDFFVGAEKDSTDPIGPDARVAEVALYDHVLTPERITQHYLLGKKP